MQVAQGRGIGFAWKTPGQEQEQEQEQRSRGGSRRWEDSAVPGVAFKKTRSGGPSRKQM
jgi:hypothetical protein